MFLVYAAWAVMIVFGIVAILTSMLRKDRKHGWVPTRAGGMIGGIALILFITAGIWLMLRSLFS